MNNNSVPVAIKPALGDDDRAIQRAMREAVLTHAKLGYSVCSWEDEKVVWHTPEEVLAHFAEEERKAALLTAPLPAGSVERSEPPRTGNVTPVAAPTVYV